MTLISVSPSQGVSAIQGPSYMEERLLKRLFTSIKCGSCGQSFRSGDIEVLGQREGMWFLRARCAACHNQCLVAAIINEGRADVVTDLTEAERERFATMDVVGADDVLDMHNFLKDVDGDFARLFRQGEP